MWTSFKDMHSGGGCKEPPYEYIFIEAPEGEAKSVFYARFGHNPERVTCTCCGDDYSITTEDWDLAQSTGWERGCQYDGDKDAYIETQATGKFSWNSYCTLEEYVEREDVLVIYAKDIKPEERDVDVPEEGYVWQD